MSKVLSIREKSNYVTSLIQKNGKIPSSDNLSYKYLYDITSFFINRKLNLVSLPSDFPEEIKQNIIFNLFEQFSSYKESNKYLGSIFPYVNICLMSELSKLSRNKYKGQTWISSSYNLDLDFDETGEFSYNPFSEVYMFLEYFDEIKIINKELVQLINELTIPVQNKHLLLFPIFLSIIRENDFFLKRNSKKVNNSMKFIFNEIGRIVRRLKK